MWPEIRLERQQGLEHLMGDGESFKSERIS